MAPCALGKNSVLFGRMRWHVVARTATRKPSFDQHFGSEIFPSPGILIRVPGASVRCVKNLLLTPIMVLPF